MISPVNPSAPGNFDPVRGNLSNGDLACNTIPSNEDIVPYEAPRSMELTIGEMITQDTFSIDTLSCDELKAAIFLSIHDKIISVYKEKLSHLSENREPVLEERNSDIRILRTSVANIFSDIDLYIAETLTVKLGNHAESTKISIFKAIAAVAVKGPCILDAFALDEQYRHIMKLVQEYWERADVSTVANRTKAIVEFENKVSKLIKGLIEISGQCDIG
jgi:hypothetical protein